MLNSPLSTVFLFDVDNTLLDNDRFTADFTARLMQDFGELECERYWRIYGEIRQTLGYADYLAALQNFRTGSNHKNDLALLKIADFLLDYPFDQRLYAHAIAAIRHLSLLGTTVILSDGDIVFQPRKIERSGLWHAFAGRVIITLHKEQQLEAVQARFPAAHYVMIDDKPKLLAAMKKILGEKLTTVFVRQGHYAFESFNPPIMPAPDVAIECVGDLLNLTLSHLLVPIAQAAPALEKK